MRLREGVIGVVVMEEPEQSPLGIGDEDRNDASCVHAAEEVALGARGLAGGWTSPHGIDRAGVVFASQCGLTQDAQHDVSAGTRGDDTAVLAGCGHPPACRGDRLAADPFVGPVGTPVGAKAPPHSVVTAVPSVGSPAASKASLPAV
ncbi:MAG: hypothetical protein ACYDEA_00975 [Candidatus Dormibacteria bacterium]